MFYFFKDAYSNLLTTAASVSLTTTLMTTSNSQSLSSSLLNSTTSISSAMTTQSSLDKNVTSLLAALTNFGQFSLSQLNPQVLDILLSSKLDLSDCIVNCSNNGMCKISNGALICECSNGYKGNNCKVKSSPCSYSPCLNNATCIESLDSTNSSSTEANFTCICASTYYGQQCENQVNLCANYSKCTPSQGYCKIANNTAVCQCLKSYSGEFCQTKSAELQTIQRVVSTASIIAIVAILLVYIIMAIMDLLHWLLAETPKPKLKIKKPKMTQPRYVGN
jgi:hypothetical protein